VRHLGAGPQEDPNNPVVWTWHRFDAFAWDNLAKALSECITDLRRVDKSSGHMSVWSQNVVYWWINKYVVPMSMFAGSWVSKPANASQFVDEAVAVAAALVLEDDWNGISVIAMEQPE
jgi:hypothetical protein